ncbi:ribosomal-processing cysteine protease Prp [Breznakiella homolactica]|uniref:Ribosomal processing cysteine protease Prp n=1 Tax=Breznakiella homolactica TaxID=2798577 RepID=A0A7T8BCH2_9SPIR|nr:ribosomal-processing cysteine protease Prp [Breznakiella homolactica]QQO11135.1 ribosomal-processing cysteine protease Prp [Breznakiella homolactica]
MITVDAVLDEAGLLKSCRVSGHAGAGPRGGDIVCAAVSVLTRTALQILSNREGITVRAGAPERGAFWIETEYTGEGEVFLSAAGVFLIEGLRSVSREYPDHCTMTIHTERRN